MIEETGEARTVDLGARFGVTSPTVNAIIQRLQREGLVESRALQINFLTNEGRDLAEASRNRHKIVYDFVVKLAPPQIAEEDAEGLSIMSA